MSRPTGRLRARYVTLSVAVGLITSVLPLGVVSAQSSPQAVIKGLTVSPPIQEITLGSGLIEAQAKFAITNTTGQDLSAVVRVVDFDTTNQFGSLAFLNSTSTNTKYGLANWAKVAGSESVTLPNGQTTNIPVIVTNAKELAPGGHYAAIVATVSTPLQQGSNTVSLKQELVSLILAKKTGGETYGLSLDGLKLDTTSNVPQTVTTTFKSTGNVHVVPRGYIEVRDSDNRLLAKGIINPESTAVLPDKSRQFDTSLQTVESPGRSKKYTVTVFYRYDGQDKFTSQSVYIRDGNARVKLYGLMGLLGTSLIGLIVVVRRVRKSPR